jgi:hypothetical protein
VILWLGIGFGLATGLGLSKWYGHSYRPPTLSHIWLVFVGFLPQFLAIYFLKTRIVIPDRIAALCLVASQLTLFLFAWLNRRLPGMWILIVGLIFNLVVMAVNGGFMPISPQTAERLVGEATASNLMLGNRFGFKDVLLPTHETRLELLADRFLPPASFPYQVAFSLGDILITIGAFWILAYQGTNA